MFRPQAMSMVELAVPECDVVPVTEALAASEVFHPILAGRLGGERVPHHAEDWHERAATFAALERRIVTVMEALGVDEGPPPTEALHLIESEMVQMDIEHLELETRAPVRALEEGQARLAQLQRYVDQLEPIADLDVDLDTLRSLRYTFVLPGTMPVANLERLQTSLELIPSALVTLRREEHLATVILFGTQRDADILNRAARSAYLNPLELPETYRGTPSEAIAALKSEIERARQYIAECQTTIDYLHEARVHDLRHLLWRVRASRTLVETIARYDRLRYTYLVTGWVPASQVDMLKRKVKQVSEKVLAEVSTPRRQGDVQVPAALDNPPVVRAFQGLVTNYGYPRYGELDPTPMMALTFPLIFGIMFGDVGHGLLLALLGLLLVSRKVRALRGLSGLGSVVIACGVTAMIFGFFYGSAFGSEEILEPLWIRPLQDVMDILLATVGIGVGLLNLGMICNLVNAVLTRRWGYLLFDHNGLAGMIFYWSLLGLAAPGRRTPTACRGQSQLLSGANAHRIVRGSHQFLKQHSLLRPYGRFRRGARCPKHGGLYSSRDHQPGARRGLLDRGGAGQPVRHRFRGNDRQHPDAASGILRVLQQVLLRRRHALPSADAGLEGGRMKTAPTE